MFDDFFSPRHQPRMYRFRHTWGDGKWKPNCDVRETDKEYFVRAEVPGFSRDGLHVDVSEDYVTMRGETGEEKDTGDGNYVRRETCRGSFERKFRLGSEIQMEGVKATLKDGVLTLTLPKTHGQHIKEIEVTEEHQ